MKKNRNRDNKTIVLLPRSILINLNRCKEGIDKRPSLTYIKHNIKIINHLKRTLTVRKTVKNS